MTPAMKEIRKNGDKIRANREERLKDVYQDYEIAIDELIDWSYKPTLKERIISWAYCRYIRVYNCVWRKFFYEPEYVACDRCGEKYETFTHRQAYGLCSSVDFENKKVRGHYGSEYDLMEFYILEISEIPGQDICDHCIYLLCENGSLVNESDEELSFYDYLEKMHEESGGPNDELKEALASYREAVKNDD